MKAVRLLIVLVAGIGFTGAAGLVIFAATIAHYTPLRTVERPADAVVVLTGGEKRIREAMQLFSQGKARRLLITGVNRATTRDDVRRTMGIDHVLFDCCVDMGYEALDTIGNADEARDWARTWGFRRLIVVTSNYHMPRSLAEFARAMPDAELVPYPVVAQNFRAVTWWLHPGTVRIVLSEYLKFLPSAARYVAGRLIGTSHAMPHALPGPAGDDPATPVAPSLMRSLTTTASRLTKF